MNFRRSHRMSVYDIRAFTEYSVGKNIIGKYSFSEYELRDIEATLGAPPYPYTSVINEMRKRAKDKGKADLVLTLTSMRSTLAKRKPEDTLKNFRDNKPSGEGQAPPTTGGREKSEKTTYPPSKGTPPTAPEDEGESSEDEEKPTQTALPTPVSSNALIL